MQIHRESIRNIALRHCVTNVRVFGSVVHGDDTDDSDLDLLVEPTSETTTMDIAKIQLELAQLRKVAVDVLTPKGLPVKFRAQEKLGKIGVRLQLWEWRVASPQSLIRRLRSFSLTGQQLAGPLIQLNWRHRWRSAVEPRWP